MYRDRNAIQPKSSFVDELENQTGHLYLTVKEKNRLQLRRQVTQGR